MKKRILITRTDRLGDVVLSTPAIRVIRKKYPDAYIAFMVRPENRDVVANNPYLDDVILYDKYGRQKSFWDTISFARTLKQKKYDIAIALHPTNRVHIMFFLAGIKDRIGYDNKMGWLLNKKVPHYKQQGNKHEVEYSFDLLKQFGFDVRDTERKPYIYTTDEDKRLIDCVKKNFAISDNIIAIHPGASCASKRWNPARFGMAADELSKKYKADIVLIGGEETKPFSKITAKSMKKRVVNLTGMLRVGELAEFLSRCRIFISNDSGPVHIAVAVNTSVVTIFGRKDPGLSPKRWGPLGKNDIVLHKDVGCKRCTAHNCEKDFECLNAIEVDAVINAADKILNSE
ncbi:MAG: lipopolysaccharide heptosyltransferase II [Candidatus Omnitrophota bacterium]